MGTITSIVAAAAAFAGGFAAWYTLWHRRFATNFEKVPVGAGRSAHVLRRDVALGARADSRDGSR